METWIWCNASFGLTKLATCVRTAPTSIAVARGDDLREIIMRPIDTEEIKAEIERLNAERQEIDERLEEIQEEEWRLPELEERKAELTNRIEEKRQNWRRQRTTSKHSTVLLKRVARTKRNSSQNSMICARHEVSWTEYENGSKPKQEHRIPRR